MSGSPASIVCCSDVVTAIREYLAGIFRVEFDKAKLNICAHRLLPGHRIGIHNDSPVGGTETHRFVVHFSEVFDDSFGGHLALFSRDDPAGSLKIVRPEHNCAVGMEFSADSWHFVDEIKRGVRYTLLYSFWVQSSRALSNHARNETRAEPPVLLDQFHRVLRESGAATTRHSGRTLFDHLIGTYNVLVRWECSQDTCIAGLFHSVFGTPSTPGLSLSDAQREDIRCAIGDKAFSLVRLFEKIDSQGLEQLCATAVCVENSSEVTLHDQDRSALVSIFWANLLEQAAHSTEPVREKQHLRQLFARSHTWLNQPAKVELEGIFGS
jgi:hypothetical protein